MAKRHHKRLLQRAEHCAPAQLHLCVPVQLHAGAVESSPGLPNAGQAHGMENPPTSWEDEEPGKAQRGW